MEYLLQPTGNLPVGSVPASKPRQKPSSASKKRPREDTVASTSGGSGGKVAAAAPANKKQKNSNDADKKKNNKQDKNGKNQQQSTAQKKKKKQLHHGKPPKAGTGLELLEPELLGAEEQATFFQAQYLTHDPARKLLPPDRSLPSGAHFKVSSTQSGGKRDLSELSGWLKDLCGERWQEMLLHTQQQTKKKKGKKNKKKGESQDGTSDASSSNQDDDKGAPSVIIITTSGNRACDIYRSLHEFNTKTVRVAKLFAKHIKLEEQIAILNAHPVRIAVGTPHRISELFRNGALKLHRCELIVLDMAKSVKGISLLVRGGEIQADFYKLYFEFLSGRVEKEQMRLSLF